MLDVFIPKNRPYLFSLQMNYFTDTEYQALLKSCELNYHPPNMHITYRYTDLKVSQFFNTMLFVSRTLKMWFAKHMLSLEEIIFLKLSSEKI